MGLFFSFKIAPGVRIRASSRGIRTSLGPRAARIHIGAGRPGFSTGAGPVTFYAPLGGGSGRRGPSPTATQRELAAAQRRYAQQQREAEARQLMAALDQILNLHRQPFPQATPPVAPPPAEPDQDAIFRRNLATYRSGTRPWQLGARRKAQADAEAATQTEVNAERVRLKIEQAKWQTVLDQWWSDLLRNHPDTVIDTLERAFEDNEAPAAAVGVDDGEVALAMLATDADVIPLHLPGTTATGALTMRKLTGTERAALYRTLLNGHILRTVRETFATAPALTAARVVIIRNVQIAPGDAARPACLMAARFSRADFDGIAWDTADADTIVADTATELLVNARGRTRELHPIVLTDQPALTALLATVDTTDFERDGS